jgi:hypothetical protein
MLVTEVAMAVVLITLTRQAAAALVVILVLAVDQTQVVTASVLLVLAAVAAEAVLAALAAVSVCTGKALAALGGLGRGIVMPVGEAVPVGLTGVIGVAQVWVTVLAELTAVAVWIAVRVATEAVAAAGLVGFPTSVWLREKRLLFSFQHNKRSCKTAPLHITSVKAGRVLFEFCGVQIERSLQPM